MPRPQTMLTGLLIGLCVTGAGLLTASHGRAATLAADQAYYLVVQHAPSGSAVSQTTVISRGQNSISTVQVGDGTSEVGCTRYSTSADAEAVAAGRYAGQSYSLVLAVDALHALAQTAGVSDDLLAMLPQLADADICTP